MSGRNWQDKYYKESDLGTGIGTVIGQEDMGRFITCIDMKYNVNSVRLPNT